MGLLLVLIGTEIGWPIAAPPAVRAGLLAPFHTPS